MVNVFISSISFSSIITPMRGKRVRTFIINLQTLSNACERAKCPAFLITNNKIVRTTVVLTYKDPCIGRA